MIQDRHGKAEPDAKKEKKEMKNEKRNIIYFGTGCLQQMRVEKKEGAGWGRVCTGAKTLSKELQTEEPAGGVVTGKKCIKIKRLQP